MRFGYASVGTLVLLVALAASGPATAAPITYTAVLSGPAEDPPTPSPGTGEAFVTIDTTAHTLVVSATFADLLSTTTAAHIHAPTPLPFSGVAGVATMVPSFTNFPLGVTAGTMPATLFDLTDPASFNPAFITAHGGTVAAAEAALALYLAQGRAYFNIHTAPPTGFPRGEIRGFLVPVPEPASLALITLGVGAAVIRGRQRRP